MSSTCCLGLTSSSTSVSARYKQLRDELAKPRVFPKLLSTRWRSDITILHEDLRTFYLILNVRFLASGLDLYVIVNAGPRIDGRTSKGKGQRRSKSRNLRKPRTPYKASSKR